MEQAINLEFVQIRRGTEKKRSVTEALDLCREAGFMRLDFLTDVQMPDYLEQAKKAREVIDARGMKVIQSHCPFFRYGENGLAKFKEFAPKAMRMNTVPAGHLMQQNRCGRPGNIWLRSLTSVWQKGCGPLSKISLRINTAAPAVPGTPRKRKRWWLSLKVFRARGSAAAGIRDIIMFPSGRKSFLRN